VILHVFQFSELSAVLVILQLESRFVHTGHEIRVDNTPLPDVVDIAIGPTVLRMNGIEVSKAGSVQFLIGTVWNVAEVFVSAKIE
jgi:TPP-dependent indolepyruvate ferredoxin oxidoreductase alpha subunit